MAPRRDSAAMDTRRVLVPHRRTRQIVPADVPSAVKAGQPCRRAEAWRSGSAMKCPRGCKTSV